MFELTGKHVRGVAVLLLAVLALVYTINLIGGQGRFDARGDIIGCDFLAFYGGARDVLEGRSDLLYDFDHQRSLHQSIAQNPEWKYFYPYVNPPFYAVWCAPFGALPYLPAFAAWVLTSLGAILLSVRLLGKAEGFDRATMSTAMLVAVAFPPAFMNLAGGQNGAFNLVLLTLCVVLQFRSRDLAAGAVLGLLLFKPQLVITMAALWVIKRRWRSLAGLGMVGAPLAIGCFVFMPEASWEFVGISAKIGTLLHQGSFEVWKQNSWYGFFTLAMHPNWPTLLRLFTVVACGLTFVLLLLAWRTPWKPGTETFRLQMAATIVASLLISPHLYVYDLTVLILPGMLLAGHVLRTGERNALSSTLLCPVLLFTAAPVGLRVAQLTSVQPNLFLMFGLLLVLLRLAGGAAPALAAPALAAPALTAQREPEPEPKAINAPAQ